MSRVHTPTFGAISLSIVACLAPVAKAGEDNTDPLTVVSVTAAETSIAAGAIPSPPHQTQVVAQLSEPVSAPIAVWLSGGRGHGVGAASFMGHSLKLEGPARIGHGKKEFVAGTKRAAMFEADDSGKLMLTLTSSNKIGDTCVVYARAGRSTVAKGHDALSPRVVFGKGEQTVDLPDFLVPSTEVKTTVTRTHKGKPLAGHDTVVYVKSVTVNGKEIAFDWRTPLRLNQYAEIPLNEVRQRTDAKGRVVATVKIKDAPGLESVDVESRDLQVFRK